MPVEAIVPLQNRSLRAALSTGLSYVYKAKSPVSASVSTNQTIRGNNHNVYVDFTAQRP